MCRLPIINSSSIMMRRRVRIISLNILRFVNNCPCNCRSILDSTRFYGVLDYIVYQKFEKNCREVMEHTRKARVVFNETDVRLMLDIIKRYTCVLNKPTRKGGTPKQTFLQRENVSEKLGSRFSIYLQFFYCRRGRLSQRNSTWFKRVD